MRTADKTLEPIRIAVALAHFLPDCSVEMSSDAGERVIVGFHEEAAITPCCACSAVVAAMRTSPDELGPLLGLSHGCPRARLLDEAIDDSHVGLGVYRHADGASWGFVFATLLSQSEVGELVLARASGSAYEQRVLRAAEWRAYGDDGLGVTVCASRYPLSAAPLLGHAEELALGLARDCLVEELTTAVST